MRGLLLLVVLLTLVCVAPTCAAGPADDPAPVPPGMDLSGPALGNDPALTVRDPVASVLPASMSPPHAAHGGSAAACGSGDDCDCCAEYFGGFGPLWETYCADKHRCRGAATACGPSRCYPSFRACFGGRARCAPPLDGCRWQLMRARICGAACRLTPSCDCDGATLVEMGPAEAAPTEAAPAEVGEPAEPTPAQPEQSVQPEPSPPPEPPAANEPVTTSSRRGWLPQRGGRLPPR